MPSFPEEGKKEMKHFKSDFDNSYVITLTSRRSFNRAYLWQEFYNNFGVTKL